MDGVSRLYEVSVKTPGGCICKYINMNLSPEKAVEQVKNSLGMDNTSDFVSDCEIVKVIEVVKDPSNKYNYIPKEK